MFTLKCGDEIKTIWNFELENSNLSNFKNRLVRVTKIDSVGNMRMRDLLDTMCHCIRQDEDEFATAGADSVYIFIPDSISLVLDTIYVPKYHIIQEKPDFSPDELHSYIYNPLYQYVQNNLCPSNCSNSLFYAILDSIYYQATYYNAEGMRCYRYIDGYEARVDTIKTIVFDSLSIPHHIRPLSSFDNLGYAAVTTTFEYYNAPSSESLFGDEMTIDLNGKNLHGFFLSDPLNTNPATRLRSRATGLGLSTASSWNVGGAATVGLGPVVCLTNASLGGNYTRSGSSSETKMTLVDLDGDGLNDKVYVKGNKLYFCRQYWNESNSTFNFGEPKVVHGIHHIMQSNSSSNTFGVQAALYASASASWTDTKSTTSSYFADVNADGLVDLIDGGQVYFNHCAKDSVPVFLRYSTVPISNPSAEEADVIAIAESMGAACGDIIFDGAANDSINCRRVWVLINTFTTNVKDTNIYTWLNEHSVDTMYSMSLEKGSLKVEVYHRELDCSYHDESPATDAVRVWIAPRNGAVDITSKIQLIEDTTPSRSVARHADGVVLSIQKTENISHEQSRFYPGSTNTHLTDILMVDTDYTMHVDSGRRVDVDSGDMIFFRLRSKADYHFDDVYTHFIIDYTDSNDFLGEKNKWHFDSQEDFVLSSDGYFQAPVDGSFEVHGQWVDSTGQVSVVLEKNDIPVSSWHVGDNTIYTTNTVNADKDDLIRVELINSSGSPVEWGQVRCSLNITFAPADGAERYDSVYITPDSIILDTTIFSNTDTIKGWLAPHVNFDNYYNVYRTPLYRRLFGPLYKGWGQFAYRSEGADADLIQIEKLVPPDMMVAGNTNTADSSAMDQMTSEGAAPDTASFGQSETFEDFQANNHNFYNPYSSSSSWVEMTPDAEHWAWVGYGHQNTVGRDTVSNSVRTDWYSSIPSEDVYTDNNSDDSVVSITTQVIVHDDPVPPAYQGTPAKAVNKVNRSKSRSWSVGFLGAGYSDSKGDNTIEVDYMDLNGDRYPDIIGTDMVQYSQQWGGVGPVTELKNNAIRHGSTSHTNSGGFSFSASQVTQERTMCGIQQNAFFTMHSEGSGSLSGGGNIGHDEADGSWVDINGDGLPDFVKTDGRVQMNIGYDFIDDQNWDFLEVHKGVSGAISVGAGLQGMQEESVTDFLSGATNISQASIEAGVCVNGSYNQTTHMLVDINGDGLPDKLWRELNDINSIVNGDTIINTYVRYNLGAGRFSDTYSLNIGRFNSSASFSESLNLGLTYGFTVWGLFKVTLGLNGCPYNAGVTQDYVQLADVNADGLPDWVYSIKEDEIIVRYNQAGKTNLLKKVTNFTGSSIDMDYTLSVASFNQPSRGWMMTRVTTNDPLNPNGGGASITGYSYSNSYYDRYERMSYGFDSVVTYQIDPSTNDTLRYVARCYNNRSLMRRGKLTFERTYGGDRKLYIEKEINGIMIDYNSGQEVRDGDCPAMAYPAVEATYTKYYEGGDTPLLITGEKYVYDKRHNVIQYINLGDFDNTHDDVTVDFSYYHSRPHNLIGLREWYKVTFAGSSAIVREAYFKYNDEGKLTDQMIGSGSDAAIYDFSYDSFGNLRSVKLPENVNGERMAYDYWYDNVVHTYPVKVEDLAFNNNTFSSYNYQFGKPVSVTSINGKTMTYTYDFAGRLTSVNSPMNNSGVPSVKNSYYVKNYYHHDFLPAGYENNTLSPHPYAITEHYDDSGSLITKTVVITDGFGRVLQTKKGLTAYGSATMQVSGRTIVDALGRTVKEYDPFTVPYIPSNLGNLEFSQNPILMTTTTYDELDRVTSKVMPLGIRTYMAYSIGDDQSGTRCFITTTRDPNNKITTQYTDYEGRQTQVIDANGGITIMKYDNLGQLIDVADPEDFHTSYGYDNFGRLVGRNHPDAGSTNYAYDPAGNIIYESNPLGEIYYDYTYYRLVQKRYSNIDQNNVTYIYGNSGNENGRIQNITDGSGSYECFYDDLGNVIEEHRAIAVPGVYEVYNFRMNYTYDSWGRMRTMVYPDGETVNYRYTWGGDLEGMDGNNGDYIEYIRNISYNGYGQKDHVEYGNNTMAEYSYDILHRLVGLRSIDGYGSPMQEISYTFDKVNNITGITNTAGPVNSMGGDYENSYNYDNLYRLVSSSGAGMIGNYAMNMSYSPSGRIKSKFRDVQSVSVSENVNMAYGYCNEDKPHAVRRMYDYNNYKHFDLRWDDAGNLGQVSIADKEAMYETGRFLYWTEDNRMHTAIDDRYYSYYAYDHSGERRLKLTGDNKLLDVNADFMATYTTLNEPTLYPSAYMVLTNKGYTKHYYAGTERVAARIGGGCLDVKTIEDNPELQKRANMLFDQSREQILYRKLPENDLDCIVGNELAIDEFKECIKEIPGRVEAEVQIDIEPFQKIMHYMVEECDKEPVVFFYHSDHLGSASWITEINGDAVQHLQYLPYGERYVDQRVSGYHERFTFTGKERDEETGYGYFGARYMDHELMTMWLSVDPMADKYPSISPYAYCAWNPVKLVDPDGREVYITGDAADKATKQLSSRGITVTRDNETGRLSYTLTGKKLSKEDKVLMEAINSKNVIVNVNATTSSTVEFEGESLGNSRYTGQFLGVSVTDCENRIATASQLVNPDVCARRDGEYKVPIGISMRHEVTEAFRAGEICLGEGASYGPCWRDWKGYKLNVPEDHVYFKAHNRATPQAIDAAPIIQERREEANFKMANIILGMSRDQWNRLDPIFRPHLP